MLRFSLLLVWFFLASGVLKATPKMVLLHGNEQSVMLSSAMEVAEVTNSEVISATDIHAENHHLEFKKIQGKLFHRGYGAEKTPLWFRFRLQNTDSISHTYFFEAPYANIDSVQFFSFGNGGNHASNLAGTYFPFQTREIDNKNFVYKIRLPAKTSKSFYLYVGKSHSELFLPFGLHSTEHYIAESSLANMLDGIFVGFFILVVSISFGYSFKNPQPLHWSFTVMMLAILLFHLGDSGLGFQYVWQDAPWFQQRARSLGSFFSQMAFICFTVHYFEMWKHHKFKVLSYSSFCLIAFYLVLTIHTLIMSFEFFNFLPDRDIFVKLFLLALTLIIPWGFAVIFQAWRAGKARVLPFYFIAFILPAIGCVVLALRNAEVLDSSLFVNNFLKLAHIITFVSLGFAMVDRVRVMRREKEKLELQNHELLVQQAEHQSELLNATTEAIMKERKNLANNLHDGLGAMLVAIRHNFSGISNLFGSQNKVAYENVKRLLDEAYKETRQLSHQMQSDKVAEMGLLLALQEMAYQLESATMKVSFWQHGMEQELTPMQSHNCYRIIQELTTNILKHAQASSIIINISNCGETISITVEDNGVGFDLGNTIKTDGIGLKNVKSRVALMNGTIDFQSQPDSGTSVFMKMPVLDPIIKPKQHYETA
ncbi:MAG: signal transduction histidine kinase [Flammeovirgaceae bacterium]|jgi:signal transduction histidine kinase